MASYLKVVQINCGGAYNAMLDLSAWMFENNIHIALLQEPCINHDVIDGLPDSMEIFAAERIPKAAIVINSLNLDCVLEPTLTNEWAVCVWVNSPIGSMYFCSLNCCFGGYLEPHIDYMSEMFDICQDKPVCIAADCNAVSKLWHSKGDSKSCDLTTRGSILEDFILNKNLLVLNEPSHLYTYCGPYGKSDNTVTIINSSFGIHYSTKWEVKNDLSIGNRIGIYISIFQKTDYEVNNRTKDLKTFSNSHNNAIKWTKKLNNERRKVRKARRQMQKARKQGRDCEHLIKEYKKATNMYKIYIKQVKGIYRK